MEKKRQIVIPYSSTKNIIDNFLKKINDYKIQLLNCLQNNTDEYINEEIEYILDLCIKYENILNNIPEPTNQYLNYRALDKLSSIDIEINELERVVEKFCQMNVVKTNEPKKKKKKSKKRSIKNN